MKKYNKYAYSILLLAVIILLINNIHAVSLNNAEKCDKSGGFLWCEEKQKCLKPFEESCNDLNDSKTIFPLCLKQCQEIKKQDNLLCVRQHANNSRVCNENYKECLTGAKIDFRNKEINISEFNNLRKECSKDYVQCLKNKDQERKDCMNNAKGEINCEKKCRDQICELVYNPVCGEDNKTYSNECFLKESDTKKECDGACPCKKTCTKNYRPVCGIDNNTYNNECELGLNNITKACYGKCPCKPANCNTIKKPVCGIDNNTYNNECILKNAGASKSCDGECPCKKECSSKEDCSDNTFCKFNDGSCLLKCDSTNSTKCIQKGKCFTIPSTCPNLYRPVCGCDGNTYSSECEMNKNNVSKAKDGVCKNINVFCSKNEDCKSDEFCKFKTCGDNIGKCTEIPEICPLTLIYQPVCGCDGNTYSSECEMNYFKTSKKQSGACESKVCDKLRIDILEELKIAQKCSSDEDCVFGNLNTPCAIYMCGASYNKNSNLSNLNEKSSQYKQKCQKFCPDYACMDPTNQISKCSNNICQTFYNPGTI